MLSGFNTNIRHRGVLFHVQTEDSGRAHPHVITHLYHGGTILASEKSSYKDLLDAEDLPARVRELIEGQHAAMLPRLRDRDPDDQVAERPGPQPSPAAWPAGVSGHTQRAPTPRAADAAPEGAAARSAPARSPDAQPLDELILDYLVETTRRSRRRRPEAGAARKLE